MHAKRTTIEDHDDEKLLLTFYNGAQVQCVYTAALALNLSDDYDQHKEISEMPLSPGETCLIVDHARPIGDPERGTRFSVWLWVRQPNGDNELVTHWTTDKLIDERVEVAHAAANDSGS